MCFRLTVLLVLMGLLVSGCYVMEYRYDPYYDGYYGERPYPVVRYFSPLEPLVDLAILGAVLYGWSRWSPRRHYYTPSQGSYRVRR